MAKKIEKRIPLLGAAYQGRNVIASGQRAINLFAESNAGDPQAPVPITYYYTPGTVLYANPNLARNVRATYRTSLGTAYFVVGPNLYFLDANANVSLVGFIADRPSQVIFADNGSAVVLVDGVNGYVIDIVTNAFAQIIDPSFLGADYVVFLDTFFVFNHPGTNEFYISLSLPDFALLSGTAIGSGSITAAGAAYTNGSYTNVPLTGGSGTGATADITVAGAVVTVVTIVDQGVGYLVGDVLSAASANIGGTGAGFTWTVSSFALAFDPLDIASKAGNADPIVGIATTHRELILIGELTTEVWIGTGAADFFFQQQQGAFIDHGCGAQFSIATIDISSIWLMQDKQGNGIIVKLTGYDPIEISTPKIVEEFKSYVTLSDAIGMTFQIEDHAFYALVFPQANKGWLYELKTGLWCEWNWMDNNGQLNRPRANCCMFVNGKNIIGDWENGKLLSLDPNVFTDEGDPILRVRTFMHMLKDGNRITYNQFTADIDTGTATDSNAAEPTIDLSWSDDKGKSFGNAVTQSMGAVGQTLTQVNWSRLGMARDRIFKLSWSSDVKTALNGAFIDITLWKS